MRMLRLIFLLVMESGPGPALRPLILQLPGLHTFRTKLEAGSHDLLAEDAVDTSASVETDTSNNINMYQWLESSE